MIQPLWRNTTKLLDKYSSSYASTNPHVSLFQLRFRERRDNWVSVTIAWNQLDNTWTFRECGVVIYRKLSESVQRRGRVKGSAIGTGVTHVLPPSEHMRTGTLMPFKYLLCSHIPRGFKQTQTISIILKLQTTTIGCGNVLSKVAIVENICDAQLGNRRLRVVYLLSLKFKNTRMDAIIVRGPHTLVKMTYEHLCQLKVTSIFQFSTLKTQ